MYPETRASNAAAIRGQVLPAVSCGSLRRVSRFYTDDWGINASTIATSGTSSHSGRSGLFDVRYRYYTQNAADFYSDLYPYANSQNFLARDKELSNFTSNTLGAGLSYEFVRDGWRFIDKASVNLVYDYIWYDYEDFRDLRDNSAPAGKEKLYSFSSNIAQLFLSIWF